MAKIDNEKIISELIDKKIDSIIKATVEQTIINFRGAYPRPSHVNLKQAAEMLDMSYPSIKKLIDANVLTLNSFGAIPINEIDDLLLSKQTQTKHMLLKNLTKKGV